ncbi:MAG: DNA polymerase III subunit alpha [Candidatus Moranbacteria bacterium]|nr:DNA polymerase III subunit alpha [Candidatus Moranbacteria bacterium]
MSDFVHLHVHSHFSLLNALPKVDDLIAEAKKYDMDALAITDTSNLYGAVEFYVHAKQAGIKAIIGVELHVVKNHTSKTPTADDRPRNTIVLLAKNERGYLNLLELVSIAQLDGFYYKARIDKNLLRKYGDGLIALSGNMTGEVPANLIYDNYEAAKAVALEYQEIFGQDNFYLELGPNIDNEGQAGINAGLLQIHSDTGIPLVAAADSFYLHPEDRDTHDILLCIQNNWTVAQENRPRLTHLDLSFRSPEEMRKLFKDFPGAIENTKKIADACNVNIRLGETQLPHFDVPEGLSADSYLLQLCEEGLIRRYGKDGITPEHRKRLDYELEVIGKTGFASYFLIVQDFVNWAKEAGIVVGPGRGSAAGSLVAYLTGITNIDPIEYTLLFERFLNPERISMPDVDMDFADDRRDDVLEYVRQRYGHDHVAQIITFGTMAAKAAIRDTGRALGFPYAFCDQISKLIPMFTTLTKAVEEVPDLKALYGENADARRIIDTAKKLEGNARHASVHACGVVITKDPVTAYSPLQKVAGHGDSAVTQYASSSKLSAVEKIGLLKMDFLGLKNLTIIQNTVRIIRALGKFPDLAAHIGIDPETGSASDVMDKMPIDDPETYHLFQEARTTGVFQFESSGMKRYLRQLKPTVIEDVIAMVALYRPGPMEYIPDFIDGKHGRKEIKYLHPKLEPILRNTYGVAVYQEQLMQIGRDLAGFSLGEADVLRKAVGKKIKELVAEQREKFIERCIENGISKKIAEQVFAFIEPFAGYGFNRSHAACYAVVGYQTAFLKAHYPAEFMAALLTSDQSDTDRIAIEVEESRQSGVEVLAPDVNESFGEFAVIRDDDGKERIRFGLNAIKNVGRPAAEEIVRERKANGKYGSLEDFLERVQSKDLNRKSLEALAKVGALDAFGERQTLLSNLDTILAYSKSLNKIKETHSDSLFGGMNLDRPEIRLRKTEPAVKKQRLAWEKELIGLYISDHPVSEYAEYLKEVATPIAEIDKLPDEAEVRIGGVVSTAKKILTKRGTTMYFVTIEDLSGRTEVIVFPKLAEQSETFWLGDDILLVEGRISRKDDSPKVIFESAKKIDEEEVVRFRSAHQMRKKSERNRAANTVNDRLTHESLIQTKPTQSETGSEVTLFLDEDLAPSAIGDISTVLKTAMQGNTRILLSVSNQTIRTSFSVTFDDEIKKRLVVIPGVREVKTA